MNINAPKAHFWSDLHLFHQTAMRHRGYETLEAMHHDLLLCMDLIPHDHTLFLLGDISFGKPSDTVDVLAKIKCRKVLIRGNHDMAMKSSTLAEFDSVHDILRLKLDWTEGGTTQTIHEAVLCHYPMLSWSKMHYGAWHLHGHSHGNCTYPNPQAKILDVGVDAAPGGPLSWHDIAKVMQERELWAPDHHAPKGLGDGSEYGSTTGAPA